METSLEQEQRLCCALGKVRDLRAALDFYAFEGCYDDKVVDADGRGMHSVIDEDRGKRARDILRTTRE